MSFEKGFEMKNRTAESGSGAASNVRACLAVLVFVLAGMAAHAQPPADVWQYCSTNWNSIQNCFDSLSEAEAYMRQENPTTPTGRAFLELTSGPTLSPPLPSNPTEIVYNYTVKRRAPVVYLENYIIAFDLTANQACGCSNSDGTGSVECSYNCANCSFPIYECKNGDVGILESTMIESYNSVPDACEVTVNNLFPFPYPADGVGGDGINTSYLEYCNSTPYIGDPRKPFNYIDEVTHGILQSGTCHTTTDQYVFQQKQYFKCDTGLWPNGAYLNAQDYYPPSAVTSIDQLCYSGAQGTVAAYLESSCSPTYGDPCTPTTGAQSETETDYSFGAFTLQRGYNSLRSAATNSWLGPSWHGAWSTQLAIPGSTSSTYVMLTDGGGHVERFDRQTTPPTTVYRSINTPGAILTFSGSGTSAIWQVQYPDGRQQTFDSNGFLQTSGTLAHPEDTLVYSYGPIFDAYSTLQAPAGAVSSARTRGALHLHRHQQHHRLRRRERGCVLLRPAPERGRLSGRNHRSVPIRRCGKPERGHLSRRHAASVHLQRTSQYLPLLAARRL
jgi:hypothetical protein